MNHKYELAYFVFLVQEALGTEDLLEEYTMSQFLDAVASIATDFECNINGCGCGEEGNA